MGGEMKNVFGTAFGLVLVGAIAFDLYLLIQGIGFWWSYALLAFAFPVVGIAFAQWTRREHRRVVSTLAAECGGGNVGSEFE